jgi:hypothetical protein
MEQAHMNLLLDELNTKYHIIISLPTDAKWWTKLTWTFNNIIRSTKY